MQTTINLPIIGYHHSPLSQKFGIPRQPNLVAVSSFIDFVAPFDTPLAFEGIEDFSHLWIVWQFHQNKPQQQFRPQVRPPRFGGNAKTGVFATRSMYRPSGLGLSVVRLQSVERIGSSVRLHLLGADMVDGTPIVDVKPYLHYADSISEADSGVMQIPPTKSVQLDNQAKNQARALIESHILSAQDMDVIHALLAQDPRPAYRQAEVDSVFVMRYAQVDVRFFMNDDGELVVGDIQKTTDNNNQ